jgi:hypothetical protein
VPPVLTGREEKNIVEAGICRVAIMEALESIGIGSSVEEDVTWASDFGIFVPSDDDSDLVGNREIVMSFVPNAV